MAEEPSASGSVPPLLAASGSGPPSPGVSPVRLSDCIEELLRFTLSGSRDEGAMDRWDPGLSEDYCSRLLQHETLTVHPVLNDIADACGGVPAYPLYKQLAQAIEQSVRFGRFLRAPYPMVSILVDESLKMKENDWSKLIVNMGTELLNMFQAIDFELHVQEPFFSQLKAGKKTVEGRCAIGNYNRIAPGSLLLFNKCLLLKVQHVKWYSSFSEMLEIETLANVLPGVETIAKGVQIYRNVYTEEKEMSNGVLAIFVSKPAFQPYISMANLLSGLSYDGIGCLLGMAHTAGTILDALPPPRSSLISSAMKPHRPNE